MSLDVNLGWEVVKLGHDAYNVNNGTVNKHMNKLEEWTEEQKYLNALYLRVLQEMQSEKKTVDLSSNVPHVKIDDEMYSDRDLVDMGRQILPELFENIDPKDPRGLYVYSWPEKKSSVVTEGINLRVKANERQSGIEMTYTQFDQSVLADLFHVFDEMGRQYRDLNNNINRKNHN